MRSTLVNIGGLISAVAMVPMAVLVLLRLLHVEDSQIVIAVETVSIYVLVPSYFVLLFSVLTRKRILAVAAATIVVCHLVWFTPELLPGKRSLSSKQRSTATHLTLYSQNVLYDNRTPEAIGRQIKNVNADFVMLEEFSNDDYEAMKSTSAFDAYPYSSVDATYGPQGLGIFSKFPLDSKTIVPSPGFPQMRATATVNGKSIVLWNVHVRAPVDHGPAGWLGDLAQLRARIHSETQPTLVAGDFNATWGHRPFRNLLTNGYHEAAIDLGQGTHRTWPVDTPTGSTFGGFVRFDHVLYNGGLRATAQRELAGNGSDHRAVFTDLALL